MTDNLKYDAILVCNLDEIINEDYGDPRSYTGDGYGKIAYASTVANYDDPRLYAQNAFGKVLQSDLNNWRNGYSAKVTDFGKWVVCDVTYHHHVTGRSASKTFLIVFNGGPKGTDKGGGLVMSTANKWRTISGVSQASSYIKSFCTALESSTSQKL